MRWFVCDVVYGLMDFQNAIITSAYFFSAVRNCHCMIFNLKIQKIMNSFFIVAILNGMSTHMNNYFFSVNDGCNNNHGNLTRHDFSFCIDYLVLVAMSLVWSTRFPITRNLALRRFPHPRPRPVCLNNGTSQGDSRSAPSLFPP